MKNEKIAIIVLVVVIIAALSGFLVYFYGPAILDSFNEDKKTVALGDCADVAYIGRFANNGTIFDTSYNDSTNKTGGFPLNIFVSMNKSQSPPTGYEAYTSGFIDPFIEGLVGAKQGQTKTIGPIPPEQGYGIKLDVGNSFSSVQFLFGINTSMIVTNRTMGSISLHWANASELHNFTMPQFIVKDLSKLQTDQNAAVTIPPPYQLWVNQTSVVNITENSVVVRLNPNKTDHIVNQLAPLYYQNLSTMVFFFPNATTATWNDNTVTLTSSPKIGAVYLYEYPYYGVMMNVTFTVENVTATKVNISSETGSSGEKVYEVFDRIVTFNRSFTIDRNYDNIPMEVFSQLYSTEVQQAGFSLNPLAGATITFEVTIKKVYKTSTPE